MDCIEEDSIRIPYLGRLWNFDVWRVSCENRYCDEHIIITKMPTLDDLGISDSLGLSGLLRRIEKNGAFMVPHEEVYDYDDLKNSSTNTLVGTQMTSPGHGARFTILNMNAKYTSRA